MTTGNVPKKMTIEIYIVHHRLTGN